MLNVNFEWINNPKLAKVRKNKQEIYIDGVLIWEARVHGFLG